MDTNAHAKLDRLERQLARMEEMLGRLLPHEGGERTEEWRPAVDALRVESSTENAVLISDAPTPVPSGGPVGMGSQGPIAEPSVGAADLGPIAAAGAAAAGLEPMILSTSEDANEVASGDANEASVEASMRSVTEAASDAAEVSAATDLRPDRVAAGDRFRRDVPEWAASRDESVEARETIMRSNVDWARLENLIAGRWYALVGALVVTIGVALFVQFAVKQGWLAQISVSARCMLGAALGFVLIGGGEWARRKVNEWASVGLTAGGLGAVYVSAYAAYALYKLVDPGTAMLLLAGVAGLGIAISAMTSLSAVAMVSLTGAYLAPIIASSGREGHLYVPAYWVALLTVGLVLSVRKGGNFAFCRGLTTLATLGFGFAWCMEFAKDSPWIGSVFLVVAWVGVHVEMWYTAARADREGLAEPYERDINALHEAEPLWIFRTLRLRSLASLTYTAWAVLLGLHLATESAAIARSAAPGLGFVLSFGLAVFVVGGRAVLNLRPVSRREVLAATLMCLAGTLLVATVAIGWSGFAQAITLCAVGLGALLASRMLRARVLDLYSMLVLGYATLRIVLFDSWQLPSGASAIEVMGFHLTAWSASTAGVAVAWLAFAAAQIAIEREGDEKDGAMPIAFRLGSLIRLERPEWRMIANFTLTLGLVMLGVSLLHSRAEQYAVAPAAVTTALAVAIGARWRESLAMAGFAAFLLMPAAAMTLMVDWFGSVGMGEHSRNVLGLVVSFKMLCGWYFGLGAIAMAWMYLGRYGVGRWWTRLIGLSGCAMLVLAVSHTQSQVSALCFAWLALCGALAFASRRVVGLAFCAASTAILVLVLMVWTARFVFNGWTDAPHGVLLYPGLWIGLLCVLLMRALGFSLAQRCEEKERETLLQTSWAACVLVALAATSLEVARTAGLLAIDPTSRGAAVSVWWGVYAIGLLCVGFRGADAHTRRAGLGLLALGVAKALIFDLASVSPGWLSVSVVVLGLFMVGVGVVYAQISRRLAADRPEPSTMGT